MLSVNVEKNWLDYLLIFSQVASSIFLVIYIIITIKIASESRKANQNSLKIIGEMIEDRDAQFRPYVVTSFQILDDSFIELIVRNDGRTQARNIKLTFTPSLKSKINKNIHKIETHNFADFSLSPNEHIKTVIDHVVDYFNNEDFPTAFRVRAEYKGNTKSYDETFVLDLEIHRGLVFIKQKNISNIAHDTEKMREHLGKIADKLDYLRDLHSPRKDNKI